MTPEQVRQLIREELLKLTSAERWIFQQHLQLFDGKNIQVAKSTGSSIGTETTQKLSVYGVTPVVQAAAIDAPSENSASLKVAVDKIRVALTNFGITG